MRFVVCIILLGACRHGTTPASPPASDGLKPWAEVTAKSVVHPGVIAIRERADHTMLFELRPSDFDRELGLVISIRRGTGTLGIVFGVPVEDLSPPALVRFRRIGGKVVLVRRNPTARVAKDTALAVAVMRSGGESILATLPIVSEAPDGRVLADPTELFATDLGNVAATYGAGYLPKPDERWAVDPKRSFVTAVHAFPANDEIDTELTLASALPALTQVPNAIDPRSISVGLRWSWFALPEHPLDPRLGDSRVGYFSQPIRDLAHVGIDDVQPDVDLIDHWRLVKKHPEAARSEPVAPIRFYIDASVPAEYRPWVRQGVLAWNKAFEAAGFDNAIVVEDAPPNLDPLDIRNTVIHWTMSYDTPYYAYGAHIVDPRTGEILKATVTVIAESFVVMGSELRQVRPGGACAASAAAGDMLTLAHLFADAGLLSERPSKELGPIATWLVMHEVGHTLGLRHNFRGSGSVPYAKLKDREWTGTHGVVASVMDYPTLNIDRTHDTRAYTTTPTLGDYDRFAIAFGYTPLPADTNAAQAERARLLAGANDPLDAYAPDEDNWLGDWSVDPLTSGGDLGDDPVAFATDRIDLLELVVPKLASALVDGGDAYDRVRVAITYVMHAQTRQLLNAMKLIGGATVSRAHKGDALLPVVPITADKQRRALGLVIERGLSDRAYRVPPDILALLGPRRTDSLATMHKFTVPIDFPVHAVVLDQQRHLIGSLLAPVRLQRIVDNQVRAPGKALTIAELFAALTAGTFGELDTAKPAISTFRRNVQRTYVDALLGLLWATDTPGANLETLIPYADMSKASSPPPPPDARASARHELAAVLERTTKRAAVAADADTRAHLEELAAHIRRALDAGYTMPIIPRLDSVSSSPEP